MVQILHFKWPKELKKIKKGGEKEEILADKFC